MKLSKVFARFYKSFNFDHHRKAHSDAQERAWEMIGEEWYPYIEVSIDRLITTVVGANESGKSHLLRAIEIAVTGEGFQHQDLCRYCDFFNVERGNDFWPHLGVAWDEVTPDEAKLIAEGLDEAPPRFTSFQMFRQGPDVLHLLFPDGRGGFVRRELEGDAARTFGQEVLPKPFRIHPGVGLPGALPVDQIASPADGGPARGRSHDRNLIKLGKTIFEHWRQSPSDFAQRSPGILPSLAEIFSQINDDDSMSDSEALSFELARKLLIQLGNVEPERLRELSRFLSIGENGHAAALADSINHQLERRLNFPKFWVQDKDFQLVVTPHERELVFTIRDRTGTQYTFDERSEGLKYFLSYFIQSQTHQPDPVRSEILLMDEPDTFLSAEAQQDLLKIFAEFAEPESGARPVQVIYVTHSPFLLDKNHAERIRVLQKGHGSDGTRVIGNASQNHYEPLRSAIGAYVGETAFIGACNLLVEGVSDQVLLAGMSRVIQRGERVGEAEILDLNRIVMVPCGSASHVPYMLYLVRGRDSDIPPVLVLLDSDGSGDEAAAVLRDDPAMSRLIKPEFRMQIGDFDLLAEEQRKVLEPEDLIPVDLAVAAVHRYFEQVSRFREGPARILDGDAIAARVSGGAGLVAALKEVAKEQGSHVDKIGFARAVVELCGLPPEGLGASVDVFKARMRRLFVELNARRRRAEQERLRDKATQRVEQQRKIFFRDNPDGSTREQAVFLLERIEEVLDDSLDAEAIRQDMLSLRHRFDLSGDPLEPVPDYPSFKRRMGVLKDALSRSTGEEVVEAPAVAEAAGRDARPKVSRPTTDRARGGDRGSTSPRRRRAPREPSAE